MKEISNMKQKINVDLKQDLKDKFKRRNTKFRGDSFDISQKPVFHRMLSNVS